jgi:pyruvate dehydrogenase E1 component
VPGTEEEIIKGMYLLEEGAAGLADNASGAALRVNLLGSGTILRESQEARKLLAADWGVAANVWSCPSFNELARDGQDCERWNLLHPTDKQPACRLSRSSWTRMPAPWWHRPTT